MLCELSANSFTHTFSELIERMKRLASLFVMPLLHVVINRLTHSYDGIIADTRFYDSFFFLAEKRLNTKQCGIQ